MRLSGREQRAFRRALHSYDQARPTPHHESVCNAPLTNLYLGVDGQAAPCWLYWPHPPARWGTDRSLLDIWRGPELTALRAAHREARFPGGCGVCRHDIATGNRPLAAAYDNEHDIGEFPTMLELELSNLCNLECVMCHGRLSSKIRKNREKLPPITSPYDESFVEQLEDFLPHLEEIRFNGGEPLLQPIVHQITERIGTTRPDLAVTVATNGTVMNARVRRMLDRCNVHINLSLDSLIPERYEDIRVHANFRRVMDNFDVFHAYCAQNDRRLVIMVNPMRSNWEEMGAYVRWCHERGVRLWFNTVREPAHLALHNLAKPELDQIIRTLRAESLPSPLDGPGGDICRGNIEVFQRFVDTQLVTWRDEASPASPRAVQVSLTRGVAAST